MKANPGKKIDITLDGDRYERIPVRTHVILEGENMEEVLEKYASPLLQNGDSIVISERVVAIAQGRSYALDDIKPGWWAQRLYPNVYKNPGGIGLRSPWTMQLAIQEAGLARILLAAGVAILTKPLGMKGLFYIVAGNDINAIDGPCDYSLPPSNTRAKLGPKNPQKVARKLAQTFKEKNVSVAIIDANDYGVRVMGASEGIDTKLVEKVFADNPMGQSDEQTPLVILRKK